MTTSKTNGLLHKMEVNIIVSCLIRNKGHRIETAKDLGIDTATLYRKMASFGIDVDKYGNLIKAPIEYEPGSYDSPRHGTEEDEGVGSGIHDADSV